MPEAIEEQALRLAQKHYEIEDGITHIFKINQEVGVEIVGKEKIRLLEVNANTIPSGIMPIEFGPDSRVQFPSVILEVTPAEYEKILSEELHLPEGWTIGDEIPKPETEGNE